jgi:hypothetical protein
MSTSYNKVTITILKRQDKSSGPVSLALEQKFFLVPFLNERFPGKVLRQNGGE